MIGETQIQYKRPSTIQLRGGWTLEEIHRWIALRESVGLDLQVPVRIDPGLLHPEVEMTWKLRHQEVFTRNKKTSELRAILGSVA